MKKIIFIGSVGAGKTTLSRSILGEKSDYKKTQAVEILGNVLVDTPGEYLERVQMRGALMISAAEADVVGLVQAATEERMMFPPCYAGSFAKEVVGIVTKIDIATQNQIDEACKRLNMAGVKIIFKISSTTGMGIDELMEYLDK